MINLKLIETNFDEFNKKLIGYFFFFLHPLLRKKIK